MHVNKKSCKAHYKCHKLYTSKMYDNIRYSDKPSSNVLYVCILGVRSKCFCSRYLPYLHIAINSSTHITHVKVIATTPSLNLILFCIILLWVVEIKFSNRQTIVVNVRP